MPLHGQRILLVEDNIFVAFDIKRILSEARGVVVGPAATLTQAIKLAEMSTPSLAVLDFRLGCHNSLPMAAKLLEAGVPFMFYTASDLSAISAAWPRVPIVAKPAAHGSLLSTLVALLDNRMYADGTKVA